MLNDTTPDKNIEKKWFLIRICNTQTKCDKKESFTKKINDQFPIYIQHHAHWLF